VQARIPRPGQPKSESYEGEGYVIVRHAETDEGRGLIRNGAMRSLKLRTLFWDGLERAVFRSA